VRGKLVLTTTPAEAEFPEAVVAFSCLSVRFVSVCRKRKNSQQKKGHEMSENASQLHRTPVAEFADFSTVDLCHQGHFTLRA